MWSKDWLDTIMVVAWVSVWVAIAYVVPFTST